MRAYVSQFICDLRRIRKFSVGPSAPFSVLARRVWDHQCPGIWDNLCPGAWDHLCPRPWDLQCPAFMELRVNLKCRIVCVYLKCFIFVCLFFSFVCFVLFFIIIKGQSVPITVLGNIDLCPAFIEFRVNLKCRLVCVCLTCFRFVIKGPSVPFVGFGTICTHDR